MATAAEDTEQVEPATGSVVWYRTGNGAEWEVVAGCDAHRQLVANGAERIDGPTKPKKG